MEKLEMQMLGSNNFRLSESYKMIRSNLMFLGAEIKAIVFTSSVQNEGKSTVSWNLAISLAESGKSVIFVDADMRKSTFMAKHRVKTNPSGLSHFLSGQKKLEEIIYSTEQENLYIITAGPFPPNPAELLSKPIFEEMLKTLKNNFDYVIIDAPPLSATADPAIIASVSDGSVMVIGAKRSSSKMILECKEQLERSGKPILGAILNMVDYNYFSYGYERYYGKYYGRYYGKYYGRNYGYYGYGYQADKADKSDKTETETEGKEE